MKKFILFLGTFIILFFIKYSYTQQIENDSTWLNWKFLIGNWEGKSSGDPGNGIGNFSFKFDLDGNVLIRNGHTVFPPQNGRAELVHDDLLIVYKNKSGQPNKAVYFDNEGHILYYNIEYSENDSDIILISDSGPGEPIMRLSYKKLDDNDVNIKFEAAMPNEPGSFKVHVGGTAERVK